MASFTGFPADTLPLLRALPGFDRDTYAARKPDVQRALQLPAKACVEAMVEALRAQVSPGLTGSPKINKSISPLHNDLRFAKEGTPLYKDHLLLWFWEGDSKKTSPGIGVRIHPDGVGFGVGLMAFEGPRLDRWRGVVDGPGGDAIAAMVSTLPDASVAGPQLKRVPKPYDAEHRHEDLLRHKGVQVRAGYEVPDALGSDAFIGWCTERIAAFLPLHRILVDQVA